MMNKERLSAIVKKYLQGKATPAEKQFLEAYYEELHSGKPIESLLSEKQISELETEMFRNIRSASVNTTVKSIGIYRRYKTYAAIAASLLVFIGAGLFFRYRSASGDNYQTVMVRAGNVLKLQLSDGTLVWLNAKSKLSYPGSFENRPLREIYLEGEAYFEVKKDKKHPFLVHTRNLTTRVLGTKFNVKAYQNAKSIEVTLLEGRVMLTSSVQATNHHQKADTLFLVPNEKASFLLDNPNGRNLIVDKNNKTGGISGDTIRQIKNNIPENRFTLSKHTVSDASMASSWRNGELIFTNEPLENVLAALNRKYDVVVKASPVLEDQPISAKFSNQSIDDVLFEITNQLKRKIIKDNRVFEKNTQYKKLGSDYYIE